MWIIHGVDNSRRGVCSPVKVTSKVSEKAEAKSDEVELLLNDLEAWQQRASLAEKEVEALSEQIRVLQESGSRSVGQFFPST